MKIRFIFRAFMVGIFAVSVLGLTMPTRYLDVLPEYETSVIQEQKILRHFEFKQIVYKPNYTIPLIIIMLLSLIGVGLSYLRRFE